MLLSGNRVCMEFDYPDVADSTTHPYFPLSGPFSVDIDLSRADKYVVLNIWYGSTNSVEYKKKALIFWTTIYDI